MYDLLVRVKHKDFCPLAESFFRVKERSILAQRSSSPICLKMLRTYARTFFLFFDSLEVNFIC